MKLGLIAVFVLLMAQGSATQECHCAEWIDTTVAESGQGFKNFVNIYYTYGDEECTEEPVGWFYTDIYENENLVYSTRQSLWDMDKWSSVDYNVHLEYIPFSAFKNNLSGTQEDITVLELKTTFESLAFRPDMDVEDTHKNYTDSDEAYIRI